MTEQIGMFDEVKTIRTADGKRRVTDEDTLAEMEMREASEALVAAEKKWEKIDAGAKAQKGIPENLCEWFDALEARCQADRRLWLLFVGKDRSPRSNEMYCEYRKTLLSGGKLRVDA